MQTSSYNNPSGPRSGPHSGTVRDEFSAEFQGIDSARAEALLRQSGCTDQVLAHCLTVRDVAVSLAGRARVQVDRTLVEIGAILHDLGRCRTHGLGHVTEGVRMAEELGLPEPVRLIIERHIGAGLTAAEAAEVGLPARDHLPLSAEEKLVAYADNLVSGTRVMTFEESLVRFEGILGPGSPVLKRMTDLHREIESWLA